MPSSAPHPELLPALIEADKTRVTAITSGDRDLLEKILSEDLSYAHSSGFVDNKQSLIDTLTSGKTAYLGIDYLKREFTFPAEGIALMSGQVLIRSQPSGKDVSVNQLSFLAVWKRTGEDWQFHAWQSAIMPAT